MSGVKKLLGIIASAANAAYNDGYNTCTVRLNRYEWSNLLDLQWHRNGVKVIEDGEVKVKVVKISSSNGVLSIYVEGKEIVIPLLYTEYIRLVVPAELKEQLKEFTSSEGIVCEEMRSRR